MKNSAISLLGVLTLLLPMEHALAHGGEAHNEAPGQSEAAPAAIVTLSEAAIHNLDIRTEAAQMAEVAPTVRLNAVIEALPSRYAKVSSRFPARVLEVGAQPGSTVTKGDLLVVLEPLVMGSAAVRVTAPITGRITGNVPALGQVVSTTDTLFEVADLSEVLVRAQAYESTYLATLKPGQTVRVTSPAYPEANFTGTIERMDVALDLVQRTLNIFARVANPDLKLLWHMQATMLIETAEQLPAVTIPKQAILGSDGEAFVFVRQGNSFERRNITLGLDHGTSREVIEGVLPDDQVVILGQYQLQFATPTKPAAEAE